MPWGFNSSKALADLYLKEKNFQRAQKEDPIVSLRLQAKAQYERDKNQAYRGLGELPPLPRCPRCNAKRIGHAKYCRECGMRYKDIYVS